MRRAVQVVAATALLAQVAAAFSGVCHLGVVVGLACSGDDFLHVCVRMCYWAPCLTLPMLQPTVQPTVILRALASGGRSAGVGSGRRAPLDELRAQQQLPGLPRELADQLSNTLASLPIIGQTVRAGGKDDGGRGPKNVIPGPAPLPMVGSSLDILRIGGLHKGFQQYAKEYGPVIKLQIGANSTFILIADPELTRQITMTDFQSFPNRNAPGGADGGVGETITDNATETIAQNANGMPVAPPVVSDKAKGPGSGGSAGSGSSVREVFGLPASQTVGAPSNSARSRWGMQTAKIIEQNREARSSEAWRGLLDSPELANQLEGVRGLWEHKIKRGSLSNANSPMNRPSQETRSSSSAVQPEEQQPPLILSRRQSPLSSPLQKRENPLPPIPGMPHLLPTPAAPAQAP